MNNKNLFNSEVRVRNYEQNHIETSSDSSKVISSSLNDSHSSGIKRNFEGPILG